MKFLPRPYQQQAHDSIFKEWESVDSTIAILPTGAGKTCLFAMVIQSVQPKRAMVIAHREELIWQARNKISSITGLECGIEMADLRVNSSLFGETPVVVSTIQTQCSAFGDRRRMSRFDPKEFGVLVIDEAHRATARSYRDLINYYKTNNPSIKILCVSATPDRADEESLGQICESVAFDYEILDAIHDGWLVPLDQQFVNISGLDFSNMRTTAGDLNGADLAAVMEAEQNMQGVAGASIEIIGSKRALVFTVSVKQAEMLSNIFNRHRAGMSDWVCGATNKDVRREMLSNYQAGKIQVVVNCNCLSEGFDDPGVEVVIQARPTKSRSLYAQQVGRCMRPLPGVVDGPETSDLRKAAIASSLKPTALVVDFVGNSGKHKLVTSADILGGKVSDDAIARAVVKAKKSGGAVRISDVLDEEEAGMHQEAEARRLNEEARKAKLVANVKYSSKSIDPFDLFQITPTKERGWDNGRVLSEKQRALLLKNGINPDKLSFAQGKQLLNTMFDRWNKKMSTLGQVKCLAKYGYTDAAKMNFSDASKLIERIAGNGWKRL